MPLFLPPKGYATSLQCSWMAVIVHTLLSQKEDQGIKAQSKHVTVAAPTS